MPGRLDSEPNWAVKVSISLGFIPRTRTIGKLRRRPKEIHFTCCLYHTGLSFHVNILSSASFGWNLVLMELQDGAGSRGHNELEEDEDLEETASVCTIYTPIYSVAQAVIIIIRNCRTFLEVQTAFHAKPLGRMP
jgi:hypothetical protein